MMSNWTHINGVITVMPLGRTQEEKEFILKTVLNHLPIVSGSEMDMETHIVQRWGHNCSSNCDEYGFRTNNLRSDYGNRSRTYGLFQTQDEYYIVLDADLRDRYFDQTYKEFQKWICRLAKRVIIIDALVCIKEEYEGKKVIISNDYDKYHSMWETPSWGWKRKDGLDKDETNWCEHLMWKEVEE